MVEKTAQNMLPSKMLAYKLICGIIRVETGLHIGGSSGAIEIAGLDNPIIKHPLTKEPYIPGSSLKGKMRSLLEWKLGKLELRNKDNIKIGDPYEFHPEDGDNHPISRIFGTTADRAMLGPTRLVCRDAHLSEEYIAKMEKKMKEQGKTFAKKKDLTEVKSENTINRITARANPRPLERVVSGVEFDFEMTYRIFDMGDNGEIDRELFKHILEGLEMIELDALGGSGSRGCGKVTFWIKTKNGELKSPSKVSVEDINEEKFQES